MNTSFLYHALGVREQTCSCVHYEDNSIIIEIQTRSDKLRCPCFHSKHVMLSGFHERLIRSVLICRKPVILKMKMQCIKCKLCGCICQEDVHFLTGKRSYTNRFSRLVVELSRIGTIQDVARFLHLTWDTVKDIQKRYLQRHYGNLDLSKLECIGIDEFAVAKGHVYKTIVVNLISGQVVYVGDGKGVNALDGFWKKVNQAGCAIKSVSTDLSAAFISSVMSNAPETVLVFDHFHIVKLMKMHWMVSGEVCIGKKRS